MKRIIIAALATACLLLAAEARAQAASWFHTVDSVSVASGSLTVTGVAVSDGTAVSRTALFGSDATSVLMREECHRMLVLALGKPGQYVANLSSSTCIVKVATP